MHGRDDVEGAADDAQLVAMISRGGERARAEAQLCARYRRRVYLYGIRHLRNAAAADDLVQDVLTTVIEKVRAGSVQEPDKIGAFVLGTSRMLVANRARGEARRARILAQYGDPRTEQQLDVPATHATDLPRLGDCLARLPDRDRTVLLLSFYAELDSSAIGREMGVEPAHVRVIRHRALGRLQACVQGPSETEA